MQKPLPKNKETAFEPHEVFFSKTDKRGIIQYGNDVFIRVSGYSKELLINSPHNVVRHPDMPKVIFRYFWDTLQSTLPIGAYVKNLSNDGSYYWVFAAVWPTEQGYLSLRLKPTSGLLSTIQKLYETLRNEEKTRDQETMLGTLYKSIQSLGFESYEQFMAHALVEELSSRDLILKEGPSSQVGFNQDISTALKMSEFASAAVSEYARIFRSLIEFKRLGDQIKVGTEKILESFHTLGYLSVNMAAESERAGEDGKTVAAVSNGFRKVAEEIRASIQMFHSSMGEILKSISSSQFEIGGARLQAEVIHAFVMEFLQMEAENRNRSSQEFASNLGSLQELASKSSRSVAKTMIDLSQKLKLLMERCESLRNSTNGLEVIRVSGKIEVSKLSTEHQDVLTHYIGQMSEFINSVIRMLEKIVTLASSFSNETARVLNQLEHVDLTLVSISKASKLHMLQKEPHVQF